MKEWNERVYMICIHGNDNPVCPMSHFVVHAVVNTPVDAEVREGWIP
jgi:hypothetical protein